MSPRSAHSHSFGFANFDVCDGLWTTSLEAKTVRFCHDPGGFLQHSVRQCSEVCDGQTATSHECCSAPRQRHTQVRPWTVAASTLRLVKFKLGLTVHRCLSNKAPHYLADSCTLVSNIASRQRLRSAQRRHLDVPQHNRSTLGRRSFSVAGPTVWNLLPDELQDQGCTESTFKQSLETYLFAQH